MKIRYFDGIDNKEYEPLIQNLLDSHLSVVRLKQITEPAHIKPKSSAITINSRLIEAPRHCIEYVMMHEFCHMIYPNHSKDFYLLLQVMMPDWKERKKRLEEMMCGY